jgi:hypothetical protein
MKRHLLLVLCAVTGWSTASAQLVHMTLDGVVTSKFEGESWWPGGGSGENQPARLHLYYDSRMQGDPQDPWVPARTYHSNSAANNFWRLEYGSLDVAAPFQTIEVSDTGMSLYSFRSSDFSTLDLKLTFASDPSPNFALPVPPFPLLGMPDPDLPWVTQSSTFVFDTGGGKGYDEGSLFVDVTAARGEIVPPFQAVPEATTYALAAALLIGTVILRRKRRD